MRPNEVEAPALAARLEELKRRASECIEASSGRLGELSREIWSRPELAYEERQAHAALTRFFFFAASSSSSSSSSDAGAPWSVQPSYHLETAFRADWRWDGAPGATPSPAAASALPLLRLGFLCEYDALPGLGHACGHNLIAEVGAGAALGLKGALESLRGPGSPPPPAVQVSVIGTPAEEWGGGKAALIKAGAFDHLDVVFMAHPFQKDLPYKPALAHHEHNKKWWRETQCCTFLHRAGILPTYPIIKGTTYSDRES